ncbi:NADH:flavin oxidoreductase/NADH oxidase, partial [Mycena olivaceomarginata]
TSCSHTHPRDVVLHPQTFAPITVGTAALQHRVVLAPLTRYKASETHRASKPGSLLINRGHFHHRAAEAGGYAHVPGIWSPDQITAWKSTAVHVKGSFIFLQLWALGPRGGLRATPVRSPFVSICLGIKEYVELYAQAAKNAVEAGFDGVEVHGANGYLVDQFLQDYGGSVANRARFALERTAIRLSPWSSFQACHHPSLAYLHLVEPRVNGTSRANPASTSPNDVFSARCGRRGGFVRAGGFTRGDALEAGEEGDLVAFGRFYISNPDLPTRLERDNPAHGVRSSTFYLVGQNDPRGYTDYPFATVAGG